jgi:acyl carrier protein
MSETARIESKLIELAAKRFKVEVSGLSAKDDFFDKLGIDSFQAMELLTDIESEFDVEIPDYELQGVNTFAGMAEVIGRRL